MAYSKQIGLATLLLFAVFAEQASAQVLEEVIVYAEKRAENVSDVPIAVTVFGAEELERRTVRRIDDIANAVPNMTLSAGSQLRNSRVNIRGVTSSPNNIGIEVGIPTYIDGIAQGSSMTLNNALWDLESIEVLRGPQGTLFGRNSIGGALLLRTRRPSTEAFDFNAKVDVGNESFAAIHGLVNIPMSDKLALRLGAVSQQRDGFDTNTVHDFDVNNLDSTGGRAQLLYDSGDRLEIVARVDFTEDETRGGSFDFGLDLDDPAGKDREVRSNSDDLSKRETVAASLEINYDLPSGMILTSLSSYQSFDYSNFRDVDLGPVDLLNTSDSPNKQSQASQEIRLASSESSRIDWVAGVFYFAQEQETNFGAEIGTAITGAPVPIGFPVGSGTMESDSFAVFGQATFPLNEQWAVDAGLRYTMDDKDATYVQTGLPPGFGLSASSLAGSSSDKEASGTIRLLFRPDDSWMFYGGYSRGFKGTGYNIQPATPDDFEAYPEFVNAIEIGAKAELAEQRLRLGVAAFFYDYTDLQTSRFESPPGGGVPIQVFGNAGSVDSKGFEVEFQWFPTDSLNLTFAYGFLDAEFKEFVSGRNDLSGNEPNRSPGHSLSASAEYLFANTSGFDFLARVNYSYRSDWFDTDLNVPLRYQEAVGLLDARLAMEDNNGRFGLALWIKNATDKFHDNTFVPPLFGPGIGRLHAPPRTYGIELSASL